MSTVGERFHFTHSNQNPKDRITFIRLFVLCQLPVWLKYDTIYYTSRKIHSKSHFTSSLKRTTEWNPAAGQENNTLGLKDLLKQREIHKNNNCPHLSIDTRDFCLTKWYLSAWVPGSVESCPRVIVLILNFLYSRRQWKDGCQLIKFPHTVWLYQSFGKLCALHPYRNVTH